MLIVLAAQRTWTCWTRPTQPIGSSCASAAAFSRARVPRDPVERAASQPCIRVKKSSPGMMNADLLNGSLRIVRQDVNSD